VCETEEPRSPVCVKKEEVPEGKKEVLVRRSSITRSQVPASAVSRGREEEVPANRGRPAATIHIFHSRKTKQRHKLDNLKKIPARLNFKTGTTEEKMEDCRRRGEKKAHSLKPALVRGGGKKNQPLRGRKGNKIVPGRRV